MGSPSSNDFSRNLMEAFIEMTGEGPYRAGNRAVVVRTCLQQCLRFAAGSAFPKWHRL
jgi:hypothetical protein